MTEKILAALNASDFKKLATELLEHAYPLLDMKNRPCGQMDGILVFDTEDDELKVVSEEKSVWTQSFIYLLRIDGNEDNSKLSEDEQEDSWLCVYESLADIYSSIKNGEFEYLDR